MLLLVVVGRLLWLAVQHHGIMHLYGAGEV
jgi:hypothetical protein